MCILYVVWSLKTGIYFLILCLYIQFLCEWFTRAYERHLSRILVGSVNACTSARAQNKSITISRPSMWLESWFCVSHASQWMVRILGIWKVWMTKYLVFNTDLVIIQTHASCALCQLVAFCCTHVILCYHCIHTRLFEVFVHIFVNIWNWKLYVYLCHLSFLGLWCVLDKRRVVLFRKSIGGLRRLRYMQWLKWVELVLR